LDAGRIEERRRNCWRADGVGTFRAAAEIFVVSRERDNQLDALQTVRQEVRREL